MSKERTMRRTLILLVAAALLSGCGLKGPLYMPGSKPPPRQPAKPTPPPAPTNQDTNP